MTSSALVPFLNTVPSFSDIIFQPPSALTPWPTNSRVHPDRQVAGIVSSIQTFGFASSVLVDETGTILCGHCRVLAAIELRMKVIPTIVVSGWTKTQKRAFVIADNKLALLSSWDIPMLTAEIEILIQEDFEIGVLGFATPEFDIMLSEPKESGVIDPDDMQETDIPADVVSREDDLWELGNHLLLCGNALFEDCYHLLMRGQRAQMAITDAPYNVAINGHVCAKGKHQEFKMASGEMSVQAFTRFLNTAAGHMRDHSQDGAILYFFMDWRHISQILDATQPLFGEPRQLCVWDKGTGGMGSYYRSQHELIFVFRKGDVPHVNNFGLGQHGRYRTNVWSYPGANSGKGRELLKLHPTVKPVGMIADAIRDCSHRKGIILDPFAGSGTILIAAERTGRYARAIELDPKYVDVGIMRWQRVTGRPAILAATGQTFEQVRAERTSAKA